MKKIIIKYVSFILVIGMLLPLFGDISVCINAKSEREITPYTFRVYTTPFSYNRFNTYKLSEKLDSTLGENDMDDLERACSNIEYLHKTGDDSNKFWI